MIVEAINAFRNTTLWVFAAIGAVAGLVVVGMQCGGQNYLVCVPNIVVSGLQPISREKAEVPATVVSRAPNIFSGEEQRSEGKLLAPKSVIKKTTLGRKKSKWESDYEETYEDADGP